MTKNSCFLHGDYEADYCLTCEADKTPRLDGIEPLLDDLKARAKWMPFETNELRDCVTLGHAAMVAMTAYERGKKDAKCPMRCCDGRE